MEKPSKIIKLLVSLTLVYLLCMRFSISANAFADKLMYPSFSGLAAVLPFTAIPLISVNRWRLFLMSMGIREHFFSLWKINLISSFQGLVLPSTQGHDAFRMFHIANRHPGCAGASAGSVIIERMFGLDVFCAVALVGLPFVQKYAEVKWSIVLSVMGFSLAAAVGTLMIVNSWIHRLYSGLRPRMRIIGRIVSFLDSTHKALVDFPYRKVMLSSIILILLFQLSTILSVYLLFRAYGIDLPFYMHMAFYPVIAIIAMMPVTIGGFGVREGAFAYFYSLVGVPAEVSVCVSVANYVVLSLLPAALGGLIWLWELVFSSRT